MTRRRPPYDGRKFTPKILDVYRRAREIYDECGEVPDETTGFSGLQDELNALLGRCAPWLTDIFDTADEDAPPDWMLRPGMQERVERWHDAKRVLTALEQAEMTCRRINESKMS